MSVTRQRPNRNGSSTKSDRESLCLGKEITCPVCGTQFLCHMDKWVYKLNSARKKNTYVKYYCRYNCWRAAAKALEK